MIAGTRGLALPLALLTLIVIGTVVAAGFAAATLEQRVGRNTLYLVQAAAAAEAGAAAVVREWQSQDLEGLPPGRRVVLPRVRLPGGTEYQATVIRLNPRLFEVRSTGSRTDADGGTLARGEAGLFLRLADSAGGPAVRPLEARAWSATAR